MFNLENFLQALAINKLSFNKPWFKQCPLAKEEKTVGKKSASFGVVGGIVVAGACGLFLAFHALIFRVRIWSLKL